MALFQTHFLYEKEPGHDAGGGKEEKLGVWGEEVRSVRRRGLGMWIESDHGDPGGWGWCVKSFFPTPCCTHTHRKM